MSVIALARMQKSENDLQFLPLTGTLLRTAHDAMVASWIALSADILAGLLGMHALWNLHRESLPKPSTLVEAKPA